MAFDFTFGFPFSLGGNLMVVNDFDGKEAYKHMEVIRQRPQALDDKDYYGDFFHISTLAQVYYPIMFKDRAFNPTLAFRLNLGGAFMQIKPSTPSCFVRRKCGKTKTRISSSPRACASGFLPSSTKEAAP